jgi:regulatory protein
MSDFDPEDKKKVYWSLNEAKINIERYCVYQDRCHHEVRQKLLEHGIYGDILENILTDLITDNFLDEERFARSYVRGKYTQKQWGRNKIMAGLKTKFVSPYCIKIGMTEIDDDTYFSNLVSILTKKERLTKFKNQYDRYSKLSSFAASKGYEYDLIGQAIATLK